MTEAVTVPTTVLHMEHYRCAYLCPNSSFRKGIPLLLIHPIGVGLSRHFWHRFCCEWYETDRSNRFTIQTYWAVVRVTCRM